MIGRFEQFCTAITSIHRSIVKMERTEMAKYGLKAPHTQCLLAMGRFPEGITAARLCEVCEKDKAAVSRTIAELETAGMVTRQDPDGKRYRSLLKLTEQGSLVAEKVNALVYQAVRQASEGYSAAERQTFVNVLDLIAGNLQHLCREGLNMINDHLEDK